MNDQGYWKLGKVAATFAAGYLFHLQYLKYQRTVKSREDFVDQMKSGENQKIVQGKTSYIRVQVLPSSSPKHYEDVKVSYNQFYLMEPSDWCAIDNSKDHLEQKMKNRRWEVKQASGKVLQVHGLQKLMGDVYDAKWSYKKYECGLIKRFWGGICWGIQRVLFHPVRMANIDQGRIQALDPKRKPIISGPIVGVLTYAVSIFTEGFFVLKCHLENGVLRGEVLAESKGIFVSLMDEQINSQLLRTVALGLLCLIGVRLVYKDLKKFIVNQKLGQLIPMRKKVLDIPDMSMEKCCIICYANNRNMLLFDCKHFIICESCYQEQEMSQCPICKTPITQCKPIYQYKPLEPK